MSDQCPLGGPRCHEAICDCFIDQYPADPLGLHPEAYVVGTLDETKGGDDVTDETDTTSEVARVLYVAAHNDGSTWEDAPDYQRAFYRRQAVTLAEAGLLREFPGRTDRTRDTETLGNSKEPS